MYAGPSRGDRKLTMRLHISPDPVPGAKRRLGASSPREFRRDRDLRHPQSAVILNAVKDPWLLLRRITSELATIHSQREKLA